MKKNLPYIIILIVGFGIVGFAGYKFWQTSKAKNQPTQNSQVNNSTDPNSGWNGNGRGQQRTGRGNFSRLHGTVTSIKGQTIVMKADDGSSKNIIISSNTRISEQNNGQMTQLSLSDVKTGDEINVMGGANQNNSSFDIQARMVIIGAFTMPQRGSGSGGNFGGGYYGGGSSGGSSNNSTSSPGSASSI